MMELLYHCVTEVANMLGIGPTGNSTSSKSFKFPTYNDDLKQWYSAKLNNKEKKNKGPDFSVAFNICWCTRWT